LAGHTVRPEHINRVEGDFFEERRRNSSWRVAVECKDIQSPELMWTMDVPGVLRLK
jgi:hypothetical protein